MTPGSAGTPMTGQRATSSRSASPAVRSSRGASAWNLLRHGLTVGDTTGQQDRFGLLLLILVLTYLLSAFTRGVEVSVLQVVAFVTVALLAVRTGRLPRRTAEVVVAVAVGGSAVTVTLALAYSRDFGVGLANAWMALVLLVSAVLIVRRVLSHSVVTLQSIFGAISAYLVIGLMFAAIFGAMNRFGGGTFFVNGERANINTLQYFSFVTLTTTGYGDFTAAGSGGRTVAVMEALIGQVFLATLVARLVAAFRPPARPERTRSRRGRADSPGGTGRPRPRARTGEPGGPTGTDAASHRAPPAARGHPRTRRDQAG